MLPSETMIWQPEFTDKTLSRKPGAVHGKYLTVGCPMKFSAFTPDIKAAPLLGEHTAAVLQELGYSDDEIAAMKQNHAI
ncbi:putative transferase [Escherichia coli]|nr:putative transferase [Escherichia coli]SQR01962.1 putative transferase [Escherichia coli]